MPIRAAIPWRAPRVGVVLIVALALLAIPYQAFAAKGSDDRVTVTGVALTSQVSAGQPAAIGVAFANNGPGTITALTFSGTLPGATSVSASHPACPATTGETISCDFGKSSAGDPTITVTFVYTIPSGLDATLAFDGAFRGDAASGNGNAASTDTWRVTTGSGGPVVVAATTSPSFFGRWQTPHGPISFPQVGLAAEQVTQVSAGAFGSSYAAVIAHTDEAVSCGGAGFGRTISVSIGGGSVPVELDVTYSQAASGGRGAGSVQVVHERDDGSCVFVPANCRRNAGNCFDASLVGSGKNKLLRLHIELPNNGRIKGI